MSEPKIFYRYDGYENLEADKYVCVRETPCGYWIKPTRWGGKERFIRKGAHKSFAYPTKELAMTSFKARKCWQIKHLTRQLTNAENALKQAEAGKVDEHAEYMPSELDILEDGFFSLNLAE